MNQHIKNPRRHEFEGESLTFAEIHKRVPVLSEKVLRTRLSEGFTTKLAMLTFDGKARAIAATRKSYAARGKPAMLRP